MQRLRLKILKVALDRLVVERARRRRSPGYRFIAEQLAQIREPLHPGELRRGHIGLELKHLQLDLQQIVLADIARLVARLGDIHRVLEALEVLVGQFQSRLGQFHIDELRATLNVRVRSLSATCDRADGGQIFGRLQAVLPLLAALKQIADAQVELRRIVEVVGAELAGLKDRQKLRSRQEHRIRPQIGGDLFRLVLLNRGPRGQQIVIVLERHLNRVIERDGHRGPILRKRVRRGRRRLNRWGLRPGATGHKYDDQQKWKTQT